jgi:hypothetical protein
MGDVAVIGNENPAHSTAIFHLEQELHAGSLKSMALTCERHESMLVACRK